MSKIDALLNFQNESNNRRTEHHNRRTEHNTDLNNIGHSRISALLNLRDRRAEENDANREAYEQRQLIRDYTAPRRTENIINNEIQQQIPSMDMFPALITTNSGKQENIWIKPSEQTNKKYVVINTMKQSDILDNINNTEIFHLTNISDIYNDLLGKEKLDNNIQVSRITKDDNGFITRIKKEHTKKTNY